MDLNRRAKGGYPSEMEKGGRMGVVSAQVPDILIDAVAAPGMTASMPTLEMPGATGVDRPLCSPAGRGRNGVATGPVYASIRAATTVLPVRLLLTGVDFRLQFNVSKHESFLNPDK